MAFYRSAGERGSAQLVFVLKNLNKQDYTRS
jgi:hypothetical protein